MPSYQYMLPRGNELVYLMGNDLHVWTLSDGTVKSIPLIDQGMSRITMICDDESVFASVQRIAPGLLLLVDADDANNGTWRINPDTMTKEKICSEYFERLYLFSDRQLLGVKGSAVFLIDTQTKQVERIF